MKFTHYLKLLLNIALVLPVLLLSACGQKGSLYLPGEAPPPNNPNIMEEYTENAG